MQYFQTYSSNTTAAGGNQYFFCPEDPQKIETGRIYYRISTSGMYRYSLLFSNLIDSTYSNGAVSHKNLLCDQWTITSARIGRCPAAYREALSAAAQQESPQTEPIPVENFFPLTFGGASSKEVMPGEFFFSDPLPLTFESGDYLCLEISFCGAMIPCHMESILPVFRLTDSGWVRSPLVPFPGMIGCDRPVTGRIAYLGDSITQGCGTTRNAYAHWCAKVSEKMDSSYAFWNLGLGFGRANDAASDGAWLFKAKQNDWVVVCYGVNDILQGLPEEQIKQDLNKIVDELQLAGCKVFLQSIPPFDYTGENLDRWLRINRYVAETLAPKADAYFDVVPVLSADPATPQITKYGSHPNDFGGIVWAEALAPVLKKAISPQ